VVELFDIPKKEDNMRAEDWKSLKQEA